MNQVRHTADAGPAGIHPQLPFVPRRLAVEANARRVRAVSRHPRRGYDGSLLRYDPAGRGSKAHQHFGHRREPDTDGVQRIAPADDIGYLAALADACLRYHKQLAGIQEPFPSEGREQSIRFLQQLGGAATDSGSARGPTLSQAYHER